MNTQIVISGMKILTSSGWRKILEMDFNRIKPEGCIDNTPSNIFRSYPFHEFETTIPCVVNSDMCICNEKQTLRLCFSNTTFTKMVPLHTCNSLAKQVCNQLNDSSFTNQSNKSVLTLASWKEYVSILRKCTTESFASICLDFLHGIGKIPVVIGMYLYTVSVFYSSFISLTNKCSVRKIL